IKTVITETEREINNTTLMQAEIKLGKDYFKLEEIRCRLEEAIYGLHNIIFNFEFSGSLIHYMRNKKIIYSLSY
ncbi:MAG: hypothetical protein LBT43_04025, partial [Prevotella sp.]|nr:hypothetical protein [Prevotella sp.]